MATTTRRRRSSYDVKPAWLSAKRAIALLASAILLVVGVFALRTVFGLAHLTNQNPLAVIGDLIGGKNSSTINTANHDLRRINFAFYGYGGPGHDGAYLTDSIMVVSVQPQPTGPPTVAEISIPRDWYVPNQLGNGKTDYGRINQSYSDGVAGQGALPSSDRGAGAAVADRTLEHLLGIHIDHWIGLDFQAFKSAVDAVGGVDVTVPNSFTDYQYPAGECNGQTGSNCAYETVHFTAGPQHMDGARALIFSRSRHSNDNGEGTDFARSRRQQLIVAALKQKVVSLGGLGNLPDLLNSLGDNVVTDLHVNDLEALYSLLKDVDSKAILHVSFDDTNFLYECGYPRNCGAAYLFAHDRTYSQIAHYVQSIFVDRSTIARHDKVTIEDGSGRGLGASGRWSSLLNSIALNTTDGGAVRRQATTQVIDESGGKDAATAAWLAKFYGVAVTRPPAQSTATPAPARVAGVVVILGQDEENAFLGNPGAGN
ncbi:MAG TPA: LCP family protein [Candidatus Dormibacteraeota bacterium]|jgi:LCP family protein required for cell wall assembly